MQAPEACIPPFASPFQNLQTSYSVALLLIPALLCHHVLTNIFQDIYLPEYHAFYGEIVIFDSGVKGMVQDVRRDEVGVILFGSDIEVKEGSKVVRTGKMAGVPVGEGFLGRIVDALGSPIDDR